MAKEFQWNEERVSMERKYCEDYMQQFIGGSPVQ